VAARTALLALDLGTTAIRAGAFAIDGDLLAVDRCPTPTTNPSAGRYEHDADELWVATATVLRHVVAQVPAGFSLAAVAVASVGEAGVPVDANGEALRPVISWYDDRASAESSELEAVLGADRVYRITGHAPDPHFAACKLLWLRAHEPALFGGMARWLSVGDLVVRRLCGIEATVPSLASRTLLFDQSSQDWSGELADFVGIDRGKLPPVLASGAPVGGVTSAASLLTGLPTGIPVVGAGHDHLCGALAAREGSQRAVDSTGSAEVVVVPIEHYPAAGLEQGGNIACYADVVPGGFVYSARVGLSGAIVEWVRRELFADMPLDDMFGAVAMSGRPSGIVMQPTFGRPITPHFDPRAALGAILGLTTSRSRTAVLQGALESTCYSLRANLDWLGVEGPLRVEGGATRSPLWMRLKADVTGRTIETAGLEEATLRGAAVLAGVGAGCYVDARSGAAVAVSLEGELLEPDRELHGAYDQLYRKVFAPLADALDDINRTLHELSEER
jgi:xylulokinase